MFCQYLINEHGPIAIIVTVTALYFVTYKCQKKQS